MLLITEEGEIWITEGIAEQFTLNEGRTETIRVLGAKKKRPHVLMQSCGRF